MINYTLKVYGQESAHVLLFDVLGRKQKDVVLGDKDNYLGISMLTAGHYVAQIIVGGKSSFQKILIAN